MAPSHLSNTICYLPIHVGYPPMSGTGCITSEFRQLGTERRDQQSQASQRREPHRAATQPQSRRNEILSLLFAEVASRLRLSSSRTYVRLIDGFGMKFNTLKCPIGRHPYLVIQDPRVCVCVCHFPFQRKRPQHDNSS